MENTSLQELARKAAEANGTPITEEHTTNVEPQKTNDDPVVIIGSPVKSAPVEEHKVEEEVKPTPKPIIPSSIDLTSSPEESGMTEEDLNRITTNMPEEEKKAVAAAIRPNGYDQEYQDYKKNLILNGFTPEEAETAANNHFNKKEDNSEPSDVAIIRVDKTDTAKEDLQLTPEEHDKLVTAKAIKLVLVEDAELKNIEIENVSSTQKVDAIRNIEGSLSKYGVPVPIYGDFLTFRGAQLIQIANLTSNEDDRLEDDLNRKANLIYSKLVSGTLLKKTDNNGKSIMNYQEFVNKFSYMDVDMAIYGILCASNPEEGSTELTCKKCGHKFDHKYNFKRLMTQDGLSDDIKNRYEEILNNRTNDIYLKKLHDATNKAKRYKSPFTNNVYDVSTPSIARMINIFKRIDQEDSIMVHNSIFASFLNAIYIYNSNTGKYIMIDDSEIDTMLDTISEIPQDDISMLQKEITAMSYSPRFALKGECPSCGNKYDIPINVDYLLFFKAQDLQREIE